MVVGKKKDHGHSRVGTERGHPRSYKKGQQPKCRGRAIDRPFPRPYQILEPTSNLLRQLRPHGCAKIMVRSSESHTQYIPRRGTQTDCGRKISFMHSRNVSTLFLRCSLSYRPRDKGVVALIVRLTNDDEMNRSVHPSIRIQKGKKQIAVFCSLEAGAAVARNCDESGSGIGG